jgi:hypothetical protein
MVSRISAAIRCDLSGSALPADRGRARKARNPSSSETSATGSKGPPQPGQRSRRWSAGSPSRHTRALQVTHLEWAMLSHASVGAIAFRGVTQAGISCRRDAFKFAHTGAGSVREPRLRRATSSLTRRSSNIEGLLSSYGAARQAEQKT